MVYKKEEILKFYKDAKDAIIEAGKIIEENFFREIKYEEKEKGEIVTPVDKEVESYIYEKLKNYGFNFEGEELGLKKGDRKDFKIILDPIDGTSNFYYKIGFFSISLALEYKGKVILGIVYNPISKEIYYAIEKEGAYYNGKKIKAKEEFIELNEAIIGFCHSNNKKDIEIISALFGEIRTQLNEFRRFGSASLEICYSINKFHGFIGIGLKVYDFKAAYLIAKEAGLFVKESIVNDNDIIVLRNEIKKEFIAILESFFEDFEL